MVFRALIDFGYTYLVEGNCSITETHISNLYPIELSIKLYLYRNSYNLDC